MPLRVVVVVVVQLVCASAVNRPTIWLEIVLTPRARAKAKAEDEVATEEQEKEQDIIHNNHGRQLKAVVVVEESLVVSPRARRKVVAEEKAFTMFKKKILLLLLKKKNGMKKMAKLVEKDKNLLIRTTSSWNRTTAWAEMMEEMFGFSESLLRLLAILMDLMYQI